MTSSHTPGPWKANGCQITAQGDMRLVVALALSKSDVLANRYPDVAADTQADGIANARLIAASPMLLEACEAALDRLVINNMDGDEEETINLLESAIRAAKGENK